MQLIDSKRELVAAVIGALVAGILSFAVGLYSLNKSFQLSQTKELIQGLRQDISLLMSVEREIDENLQLVLTHNYTLDAKFEPFEFRLPSSGAKPRDKEYDAWIRDFMNAIGGKRYTVTAVQSPSEKFVVGAWPTNPPSGSDIDFELSQAITAVNRKFVRANTYLDGISTLAPGSNIDEASKNALEHNFPRFNEVVSDITKSKLLQLKNQVNQEIKRLQKQKEGLTS